GNLYFENLEAFQNSFGPNAEKIMGDLPNFTNIEPVIQIAEVVV
ncbi:MAG TPA: EthD family reductase, partial [Flavobacteriales bacterium]|nr:EthD family reductase [Flavobacteriales bacterium]